MECECLRVDRRPRSFFFAENVSGSMAHGRVGAVPDVPTAGGDPRADEEGQAAKAADLRSFVRVCFSVRLRRIPPLLLATPDVFSDMIQRLD